MPDIRRGLHIIARELAPSHSKLVRRNRSPLLPRVGSSSTRSFSPLRVDSPDWRSIPRLICLAVYYLSRVAHVRSVDLRRREIKVLVLGSRLKRVVFFEISHVNISRVLFPSKIPLSKDTRECHLGLSYICGEY